MIGRTNTGKSSVVRRYVDQNFDENDACTVALETNFKTLNLMGKTVKLKILDTASDRMDKVARSYYTQAMGVFFIYDVTNQESFEQVIHWLRQIELFA